MLKNYFVVAFRSLLKNKSYVIVNAFGVGMALACCVAAYLVLAYDIEFDDFYADEKVARIFNIHTHLRENDGAIIRNNNAPMVLPAIAASEIAGIGNFTRYIHDGAYMRYGDRAFMEKLSFADVAFFDMFDFPLVAGNCKAFKDKHSIFLSEELARKYFGNEEAVGKLLMLNFPNEMEVEVIVGGVLKKVPINNTFNFNAMMRIETFLDIHKLAVDNWGDERDPSTFVELTSAASAAAIGRELDRYISVRNEANKNARVVAYQLEHFKAHFTGLEINSGNTTLRTPIAVLTMFTSMAVMILLAACFNLTNTTLIMTAGRLKEIGIRKSMGAFRREIVAQFLLETIMVVTLSLGVGLMLAQWIVPAFTSLYKLPFTLGDISGLNLVITLIGLVFFASLVAGIYPALFNSKFKPIALLKSAVRTRGTNNLTRTLVTIQFSIFVIVLIGGVVYTQNAEFQEAMSFGYDKEMVITVNIQGDGEFEAMKNAMASNPKILAVAVSDHHVGQSSYESPVQVGSDEYPAHLVGIGENYLETMGLKLHEGRFLNVANASDRKEAVIVNRAFVDKIGMKEPLDAIITVQQAQRRIVGVIENHIENMFIIDTPTPFVFYAADSADYKMMQVRAEEKDLADTRGYMENTWKRLFPTKPFESQYQEDIVLSDARMLTGSFKTIFLFLAVLGGLLSVSGIFSVASLSVARRTKEIGIRKALGARVGDVVALLNKEFIIILGLAAVGGSVGGFYLIDALLSVFNMAHIRVSIVPVTLCGLAIFCTGIIATSFTILKAANTNPVDTLRSE